MCATLSGGTRDELRRKVLLSIALIYVAGGAGFVVHHLCRGHMHPELVEGVSGVATGAIALWGGSTIIPSSPRSGPGRRFLVALTWAVVVVSTSWAIRQWILG